MALRKTPIQDVRNIGIIAHIDAGKTTLTERMLYFTGSHHKLTNVDEGNTEMDYMEDERERGITITSAATTFYWDLNDKSYRINLIDTPGHVDFTAEVERALRVLDASVVVFDGAKGVEPQSEKVWRQADSYFIPRVSFINKMDKLGADFHSSVESIEKKLGAKTVILQLPIGSAETFEGIIDLIKMKEIHYEDDKLIETDIRTDLIDKAKEYREKLIGAVSDYNDIIYEKYINEEEINPDDLYTAIRKGTLACEIFPVLCGSAFKTKGVQNVLDAVIRYFPAPSDLPPLIIKAGNEAAKGSKKDIVRYPKESEPFTALAFKVQANQTYSVLSYLRIYAGKLKSGDTLYNATTGKKIKINRIVHTHANKLENVDSAYAGEIVALIGNLNISTGHTILDTNSDFLLEDIKFPEPVIYEAIEPRYNADHDKLLNALRILESEDPTFIVNIDEENGQMLINGMGELHLEVIKSRLKKDFNVDVYVSNPRVQYRETITNTAVAEGKYIKQSATGNNFYGHTFIEVSPLARGEGFKFVNRTNYDTIPKEFIEPIKDGVKAALTRGPVRRYPVIDIKVALKDGSYHRYDSNEISFREAAREATEEAVEKAMPVLLEPIMEVMVITPPEYMGDIIGDLNAKGGKVYNIEDKLNTKIVYAEVPLSKMFGYATDLRNKSQGRASFNMEFSKYDTTI
ncbi:MAG: elongation factor G [Spirochaetota bacterium]